jgi:F-type H+-transporting ATPase subunit a
MIYVARRMQQRPNRLQTPSRRLHAHARQHHARQHGRPDGREVVPLHRDIFLFIWFSNIIGYLPLPTNTEHTVDIFGVEVPSLALYAATANLSVPLVLTLMVWLSYHVEGIRAKGFVRYLKSWIPPASRARAHPDLLHRGHLAPRPPRQPERPTLRQHPGRPPAHPVHGRRARRAAQPGRLRLGRPRLVTGVMAVAFFLFEVGLVATLQAFIFATLTAIYLGGAVADEH